MARRITLIPGDGIGPEVIRATCRVLEATGVALGWDSYEVGGGALRKGMAPLPVDVVQSIRRNGVALKGPVSTPVGQTGFRSVNVALRRSLGLYAQLRHCQTRPGAPSRFADVDLVVIRDTMEDLYAGVELGRDSPGATDLIDLLERHGIDGVPHDAGLSIKFVSEPLCRRLVGFAFDYAESHCRRKVTAVHKASVMRCTDGLFLNVARDVASHRDKVEFDELQIDNLCGQLVRRPQDFDVLVMGNLYGDIVSDLTAGVTGGIGLAPGANYGSDVVLFEPAHGTAPRHAGRDEADPTGAILSGALLLDHVGESQAARRVEAAVAAVLAEGRCLTYDLKQPGQQAAAVTTSDMADAVIAHLEVAEPQEAD